MRHYANKSAFLGSAILAALLTIALSAGAQVISLGDDGLYRTRPIKARVALKSGGLVEIRAAASLQGKLKISVHESDSALLVYRKVARTDARERAVDYIDLIGLNLTKTPTGVRLEMRSPNPAPWEEGEYGAAEVELWLPVDCDVEVDAVYFDMVAEGPVRSLTNTTSLGRLTAGGVTERLRLTTANQRITIEDVGGSVAAATTNATLKLRNARCGDATIDLRNENGDIQADQLTGGLNVSNSYGRIEIANFRCYGQNSFIRGNTGPMSISALELVDCQLLLNNRYEDIELWLPTSISTVLSLAVDEEGRIDVSELEVRSEMVQPNRLNLVAGEGQGLINASVRGRGDIFIRGIDEEEQ